LNAEFKRLLQLVMNIVKIGTVRRYNPENHTAVVEFKDFESVVSRELQIVEPFTYQNKNYMPLREGQKAICILLPQSGTTDGFIIGTVYDDDNLPPVRDKNKFHTKFEDGTVIEYDTAKHKLTANVKGKIFIHATGNVTVISNKNVLVKAKRIDFNP